MTHTLQAIAWTLVHFCWQAAAVAVIYAVAAHLIRKRPSHVRYLLALTALMAMFAAAAVTFAIEMAPGSRPHSAQFAMNAAGDFPRIAQPGRTPDAATVSRDVSSLAERMPSYVFWIDVLWLMGVCGLSCRNLGGWWVIRRLRNGAGGIEPPVELRERFLALAARLGIERPVLLRVSEAIAGPVTVGAIRTVVLLPLSAISGLGPDELEVVLAHELAHVRRADFLWNIVQTLVETLFFFHPAVWWISGRIRHERELCCDDLALEVCPNPVVYASALFHLEEQRSRQLHLAMALDGHQTRETLRMRIARILGEPSAFSGHAERPFSLAPVLAGVIILLLSAPQVIASLRPMHIAPAVTSLVNAVAASPAPVAAVAVASVTPTPQAAAPKPAAGAKQPEADEKEQAEQAVPAASTTGRHESYIDAMKAAGYGDDLDKLIAMKIQDITPDYARAMAQVGFGKPSAEELIACKIQGVSPEVINQLKQQGLEVKSLQDAISYRIFNVTPEFVAGMKAAGFANLDSKQLLALRVQNVTPEYARSIAQQFPDVTADELVQTRIFNITSEFIASAKAHGFKDLSLKKLVQLRISGLLDDEEKK